jgi:Ca-activated chloride channel family protein
MNAEYPSLLLAIPLLVVLAVVYGLRSRSRVERKRFPWFIASTICLIVALANPYWSTVPSKERIKGVDLILVLDVSQSMFSQGVAKISRIDLARKFIKNILPSFRGSQVAIIYFAGDAQVGSPFTSDFPAINLFLDAIAPAMSAQGGTRTDSIGNALEQLIQHRAAGKLPLVLLFSDGEFFDSGRKLQSYLQSRNLRAFTYLCGDQKGPVLNYDLTGPVAGAFSTPNPMALQKLAAGTNGAFFNLAKERMDKLSADLNSRVEDVIVEGQSVPDYRPVPFLILAIIFLLIYQWIPFQQNVLQHSAATAAVALLILLTTVSMKFDESRKAFESALQDIAAKKYEQALKELNGLPADFPFAQKEIAIGNAYYFSGKYDEAIRHYQAVLKKDRYQMQARWNWEVALKRKSEERQPPPQPKPQMAPQNEPQPRNALLDYVDQLEKEQRQKSNRTNIGKSEFQW